MKSHFTVEQFFHPRLRTPLGIALAGLRVAFAVTLAQACLRMQSFLPDVLTHLRIQGVPFLEVFATFLNFSAWRGLIIAAAAMFALGFLTRISAAIFFCFLFGMFIVERSLLFSTLGMWSVVSALLLCVALFSQWGKVFGVDEVFERMLFFWRKRR